MSEQKHLVRGVAAGVLGGLAAAWVMNVFEAGPGKKLTEIAQSDEQNRQQAEQAQQQKESGQPKEDSTMKAADAVSAAATGEHLSQDDKETAGPIVHYTFGAVMGGLYGGLSEYVPAVRAGFGTTFATALFAGADLVAVPALKLSAPVTEESAPSLLTPYAAHLVYGITTELVRRLVRLIL